MARRKLSYREREERRRFRLRALSAVLVVSSVLGGAYALTLGGPKPVSRADRTVATQPVAEARRDALRAEAERLFAAFSAVELDREPTAAEHEWLLAAETTMRQLIRESGNYPRLSDQSLLDRILSRVDFYAGERISRELESAAQRASSFLAARDFASAANAFDEAADRQRLINNVHPRSPRRNPNRLTGFEKEAGEARARPLHESVIEQEGMGRAALAESRFEDAVSHFLQALEPLNTLLLNHRQTRFAEQSRKQQIEVLLATARSGPRHEMVKVLVTEADQYELQGNKGAAVERLESALSTQRSLNRDFPTSRFASLATVDSLESRRLDLISMESAISILERERMALASIQADNLAEALRLLSSVVRDLDEFERRFGAASSLPEATRLRIRWLDAQGRRLSELRAVLLRSLIPVPGFDGLRMLDREVWQEVFERVTGRNPSRTVNPLAPVDSVTYEEATLFADRVSWILGGQVRLPRREEFLAAVGTPERDDVLQQAVSSQNSGGIIAPVASRPPNPHGFHDLLGNVSEWVTLSEAEFALEMGGNARDNLSSLLGIPSERRTQLERNRFRGFRIVQQ